MTRPRLHWLVVVAGAVLLGTTARADAPAGRFIANNGTILDTVTGLTWQQQATSDTALVDQIGAARICSQLDLAGKQGFWRLPSLSELHTIIDERRSQPALDPLFKGAGMHWSKTLFRRAAGIYWAMETATGHTISRDGADPSGTVRCVY